LTLAYGSRAVLDARTDCRILLYTIGCNEAARADV
jgi:hypothetical protein